jgi:Glycosyl transferase family 2
MGAPGWDDAPLAEPSVAERGNDVTIVWPYYENPNFLAFQLAGFTRLPDYVCSRINLIVADDGSPDRPAEAVFRDWRERGRLKSARLFRLDIDIRWNWLAARNVAMHHAPAGWCAVTDIDHVFPPATILSLITRAFDPGVIYRFSRREHTGARIHPHPNSFLIDRAMFWKVGGYDETLSGFYGTDGDWRRRCAATAPIRTLAAELERHEFKGDSSTLSYLRKQQMDRGKKAIIRQRGKGWRPRTLSFPYHEVTP